MIYKIIHLVRLIFEIPNKMYNLGLIKLRNVHCKETPTIFGRLVISGKGRLKLGKKIRINSNATKNPVGLSSRTMFYIAPNAIIDIGNNVGISSSLFYSLDKIIIEDNVLIGGGCQILDNDFHSLMYEDRVINGDREVKSSPILVKEGAFIGTSSIILKGVTIGERSIVAAGSVVVKSIPDNQIWGGNPAKFIRNIDNG